MEPFHLTRYVEEQVFRYNNRATTDNPLNDSDRFALVVSQIVGRRITYAQLTGKADARPFEAEGARKTTPRMILLSTDEVIMENSSPAEIIGRLLDLVENQIVELASQATVLQLLSEF